MSEPVLPQTTNGRPKPNEPIGNGKPAKPGAHRSNGRPADRPRLSKRAPSDPNSATSSNGSGRQPAALGMRRVIGDALRALGPSRKKLYALSALAVAQSTLETLMLYLIARMALGLANGKQYVELAIGPLDERHVRPSMVLLVSLGMLVFLLALSVPIARLSGQLSIAALVRGRTRLAEAWFASSYTHRADQREGQLHTLLGDYTQRIERLVHQVVIGLVAATSLLVMALGTVVIAPVAALLALGGLAGLSLAMRPFSASIRRTSKQWSAHIRAFSSSISQVVRLSQEIVAFDVSRPVSHEMHNEIVSSAESIGKVRYKNVLAPTLYQYGAMGVILFIISVVLVFGANSRVGAAAPVILLMIRALTHAKHLQHAVHAGNEAAPYVEALDEELEVLVDHPAPNGERLLERLGRVEVDRVSYAYGHHAAVLHDVSFVLDFGSAVGVVGPSGGGKSTLVQLLLRLRTPTHGRITLDGIDLQDLDGGSLSRLAAFVPQDNKLIFGTIADNIRFFRSGFSDEDVTAAARAAHVHEDICLLPDGYATVVGTGARDLSGGQRQRLGIARALLGRPALLVLDEPTSALDARSENLIRDTLVDMRGHTTIVAVAHRPATIDICDRVLRVEQGQITEVDGHRIQFQKADFEGGVGLPT